ncbi:glycosyltransferase family 1 protein [Aneurinibacillus sp. Ricciae_BoGa-3]|uniref:glycosyltransferase family 4 protein n=1 Tax=Aneurinibacillus sp. Ricciae_BoGa-3 TaxID=3022697 RepID=UPI0023422AE0|nr:glycosyltransferase family 1 protein [Aneurinibacillus sp. Ricciae_BoGa-3]WCK54553.1 glycosyltransferase family 1 protein [Aneurinibacillus sp. Ricciae_BoGa-3]
MKIAIVTETFLPSTDGIVTRICETIKWCIKEGHEILVIAPDLGVTEFAGAKIKGIPAHNFFVYPEKKFSFPSRKVKRYLDEFQPDLIHVLNPALLGAAGIFYGSRGGWPLVASYHTRLPEYADYYHLPFLKPLLWWYLRNLHNQADLNLCTSKTMQTELQKRGFQNVQVWDRGVDTKRFGPHHRNESMRQRLTKGRTDKTLLMYVGRLAAEKEIAKIRNVLEASKDFCLAIVGDGPYRSALEEHFRGTQTIFTGFLHGLELAEAYASSDIFIFPSTTETLGLVLLESMASGLPVVAARSGPSCEQIQHEKTGILFEPDNPDSLVKSVLKLQNKELRAAISVWALNSINEMSWEKPSYQLLNYYTQELNKFKSISSNTRWNV